MICKRKYAENYFYVSSIIHHLLHASIFRAKNNFLTLNKCFSRNQSRYAIIETCTAFFACVLKQWLFICMLIL